MNSKKHTPRRRFARSRNWRSYASTLGALLVIALLIFTLFGLTFYQRYTSTGAYRQQYEGRILDKSQTVTESQRGSGVRRRLLIEGRGGERFEVTIDAETYERARRGMWIKKTADGVQLTWPLETEGSPAAETSR